MNLWSFLIVISILSFAKSYTLLWNSWKLIIRRISKKSHDAKLLNKGMIVTRSIVQYLSLLRYHKNKWVWNSFYSWIYIITIFNWRKIVFNNYNNWKQMIGLNWLDVRSYTFLNFLFFQSHRKWVNKGNK